MKKSFVFFILLTFFSVVVNSQNFVVDTTHVPTKNNSIGSYKMALGVKMYPSAISFKKFSNNSHAFEVLGYFTLDGFRATLLKEKYQFIEGNEQLRWYVGYGGHLGIWSESWKKNNPSHTAGIALGVDGILGLDYAIKNVPLNISIDWQPSFNFVGASYFESGWAGIGIRYILQ